MAEPVQIGILLYPQVTQLDATGPAQVLCRVPGATLHMIWKTRDPVPTDAGVSRAGDGSECRDHYRRPAGDRFVLSPILRYRHESGRER